MCRTLSRSYIGPISHYIAARSDQERNAEYIKPGQRTLGSIFPARAVLVRHGNGKSTPEDADYAIIATTVWKQVQQAADDLEDGRLIRLKLLSEKVFCIGKK